MKIKEKRVKRIYAFVLMFVIVLQSVFGLEQRELVNAATETSGGSEELYYTVYFSASEISDQEKLLGEGVFLHVYDKDSEGNIDTATELSVEMEVSDLADNFYVYTFNHPYTIMEFIIGDSVDEAIKSDPVSVDWDECAVPCFTMALVSNNDSSTGESDVATSSTGYTVEMDLTDLKDVVDQMEAYSDDSETDGSGSGSDLEDSSGDDSGSNSEDSSGDDSNNNSGIAAQSEDSDAGVSAVAFTPNSNYLYFNPAGISGWENETVYIFAETWGGFAAGDKDTETGYWYWDITNDIDDKSHVFGFAIKGDWTQIKSNNLYRTTMTSDVTLEQAKGKIYVASGISDTKIDNQQVYDITESLEGQTIYFADYTLSTTSVSAVFSNDSAFSDSSSVTVPMTGNANGVSELYSVTIPGAQKYVKFVDASGNRLGDIYNFYGGTETSVKSTSFSAGTNDTYHYGITEKKDGTIISSWGAGSESNATSIAGKTLYFNNTNFSTGTPGSLMVGTEDVGTLSTDSSSSLLTYTFPTDIVATHSTILTYITTDGTKYHFKWSDTTYNKVTLTDDIASVSEKYIKATTVYFDATLSKLDYSGDAGDYEIPNSNGKVYCYATGDNVAEKANVEMELVSKHTEGNNTWSDVYKVELPEGYDKIVFSGFIMKNKEDYGGHGESTTTLSIPVGLTNPCFYADSSDSVIYDGGQRGGYWAEVYTIRDAESNKGTDVVDIKKEAFSSAAKTLYVNSTFYDYYTDYELNGNNRDTYNQDNSQSYRNWVTFRQFNQALSDYYADPDKNSSTTATVNIPIYTGHFQPSIGDWGWKFEGISSTLKLFGHYDDDNTDDANDYNTFFSTNNSNLDINGNTILNEDGTNVITSSVAQGLVSSELVDGSLSMKTSDGNTTSEPHFDEDFLTGNNSKNAVLGEVYQNVAFPFTQRDVKNNGVNYWYFDSKETTLAMKQDTVTNAYYLKDVGNQNWSLNVDSESTSTGVYGFFPFNETSTNTCATTYNYGYGVKLEFQFRLTEDGTVLASDNTKVPITFEFSGDDDVWVFIDGNLVLDVGGAHGIATGSIDFKDKKATVQYVKASAGQSTSTGKDVTNAFSLVGNNEEEHTLTMYYMERGMWESNMKISFNFPDENQLEIQKEVDDTEVNALFDGVFDDKSLFTYTIKNQATHYGTTKVSTSADQTMPQTFYSSATDGDASSEYNTCEEVSSKDGQTDVIHWFAKLDDKTGSYRTQRYGTITADEAIDISNMSYLQFKFYYDYNDTPSLSNMYMQLVDANGNIKGDSTSYLNTKTYGMATMGNKKWITVKIDLSKLNETEGFNSTKVSKIKFGYNYQRDIYLDDFVFYPSVVSSKLVGFITKQYDIADYGSATSGNLEIPKGAVYISSTGATHAIGEDGTFVLKNHESVTFSDQFRRGSYIYLEEESSNLFDTSWTMYDNGMAVTETSFKIGTNVTNGSISFLKNIKGTLVYDDRTEQVLDGSETNGTTTYNIKNAGYTTAKQPTEGSKDTFVFRSYSNPDDVTTTTKLKIVFTNKVKTGSLVINKESLYESEKLSGTYTFKVTFYNVGGIGLENESIVTTFTLQQGESYRIDGIPLGTFYRIEEVTPTDTSYLGNVTVSNKSAMQINTSTMAVEGVIIEKEEGQEVDSATFYNTSEPKISADVEKIWKDEVTGNTVEENLPDSIYVQLQRKKSTEGDEAYQAVSFEGGLDYSKIEIVPVYEKRDGVDVIVWSCSVNGLDMVVDYPNSGYPTNYDQWIYRFVELDQQGNAVENGKVVTIADYFGVEGDYKATYETTKDSSGKYSTIITNTLLSDVNLQIIKLSADNNNRLSGVKFQLEKWKESEGKYEIIGEQITSEKLNEDVTTEGEVYFESLSNGIYRLTEIQTAEGYTLLKSPVIITIDRKTDTYTYQMESEEETNKKNLELSKVDGVPTLTLSIKNTTNMTLPQTGVRVPVKCVAAGALLCLLAGIMYMIETKRRRKEGKCLLNNKMYSRQENWASGVMEKKKERNEKMKKQSKIKRIATALLALVLTISMLPVQTGMTAYADTKMPTIDKNATGTLTIHKYEYNGTQTITGTGSEITGTDTTKDVLPTDDPEMKGLNDVTFRVTRVADLTNYYGANGTLITLDEAQIVEQNSKVNGASDLTTIGCYIEVKTAKDANLGDGIAKLENLPLGIYLVQETEFPAQITTKAADFVVSIPMTNAEGNDWNYDVHVYPKNKSTYAGVTLIKQGKVGDDTAAPIDGVQFVLQRKGTDNKWSTVTENNKGNSINGDEEKKDGVLTTDTAGKVTVSNLAPGEYRFVETSVKDGTGYIMDGVTTYEFKIAGESGTINNKNYETGAIIANNDVITKDSVTDEYVIGTAINYKPDVEKEVCTGTDDNGTKTWGNASDYNVGDTVKYRIKVDVPENVASLRTFTISDKMDNLTYVADSLKIYSDADCKTEITFDENKKPTIETDEIDDYAWSIAFNSYDIWNSSVKSALESYHGQSIYIYFETTLNEGAKTTAEGNVNTVNLEYSNEIIPSTTDGNPNEPKDGTDPEPGIDEIIDEATVYTFDIFINKTAKDTGTGLSGVTFDLYKSVVSGTSGAVTNPVTNLTGTFIKVKTGLTTSSDADTLGQLSIHGLEKGNYYLVETKTYEGYNLLQNPVAVEIKVEYTVTLKETTIITEDGKTTTTKTYTKEFTEGTAGGTNEDKDNGIHVTNIINSKGFQLPTTGGIGTYIFFIVGISMMAAAVILFVRSKKKEESK